MDMDVNEQIALAKQELKQRERKFRKRRTTKLVRISEELHVRVKSLAKEKRKTMSKQLDLICRMFFKNDNVV